MPAAQAPDSVPSYLAFVLRGVKVRTEELRVLLIAFAALFCLFTGYASLRPVRDSLGVAVGTRQLGNLFGWTFVGMLTAMPIFGWLASQFSRRVFLPVIYCFFILNLLGFYVLLSRTPHHIFGARLFFVWVSVVNLFIISAFWSLMADLHRSEQSSRLFGFIAAGGSAGSIVGPALTALLVKRLGNADLLLLAAGFWSVAVILVAALLRHRPHAEGAADRRADSAAQGPIAAAASPAAAEDRPLGGNPLAGIFLVGKSPYLMGIGLFILLLSAATTLLYLQQAALLAHAVPDPTDRTRLLAALDTAVNVLSLLLQLLVVGRLTVRIGVAGVLLAVPAILVLGFLILSLAPALSVLIGLMLVRRVGEYGLLRPSREVLFTSVDRPTKYKAKSFIDTVIYRGADWLNAKLHELLVTLGLSTSGIALGGAAVAAVWAAVGFWLGRRHAATRS